MSTTSPGTIADSLEDGTAAAPVLFMELEPEHFTNPGADSWGDPGCNLADAAVPHAKGGAADGRAASCPSPKDP